MFFPMDSKLCFVRQPLVHISVIKSLVVCDSVITTYLNIDSLPVVTEISKVCKGADFTSPDGWSIPNVQDDVTHTSYLHSSSGCDTMIITTMMQVINPTHTIQDTSVYNGSSFTFPDDSKFINIQLPISHISHLKNMYGRDSNITTNIKIFPLYQATKNVTVCAGTSYTFSNDTTINNITTPLSPYSHFLFHKWM